MVVGKNKREKFTICNHEWQEIEEASRDPRDKPLRYLKCMKCGLKKRWKKKLVD